MNLRIVIGYKIGRKEGTFNHIHEMWQLLKVEHANYCYSSILYSHVCLSVAEYPQWHAFT